jgi:aspartyl-tRNA(Asn)/glutamyl-tRNA(Gln) amidotransferase subunit C
MSLTRDDVKKVAGLARLRMTDDQMDELLPKMNIEPLSNVARSTLPLRKDEITDGECRDKVLANAPESEEGFFGVPKVVE